MVKRCRCYCRSLPYYIICYIISCYTIMLWTYIFIQTKKLFNSPKRSITKTNSKPLLENQIHTLIPLSADVLHIHFIIFKVSDIKTMKMSVLKQSKPCLTNVYWQPFHNFCYFILFKLKPTHFFNCICLINYI